MVDKSYLGSGKTVCNPAKIRFNYTSEEGFGFYSDSVEHYQNLSNAQTAIARSKGIWICDDLSNDELDDEQQVPVFSGCTDLAQWCLSGISGCNAMTEFNPKAIGLAAL